MTIRILIADDHSLLRVGLVSMLSNEQDISVVAEAHDGEQAIALFEEHRPDITILDVRMPVIDGIETLSRIRAIQPDARVIMLSTAELEEEVSQSLKLGAAAFVTKAAPPVALVDTIQRVQAGEVIPHPLQQTTNATHEHLSPREIEVLHLVALGRSNKQIAVDLNLSIHTVKTYIKGILAKFDVQDRAGAVSVGYAKGILKV
ncbi:response regulator [Rhodopirellula sp. SWK7]|uniref:response regulator n=1 Tax=Rhodopirellula sp. SWK7 TaxID=595460 RepID=UPI0005C52647|nr:response regulator transcription factor [Rhodopirellula sp. SWK7]